jgi:hypothetical protein
VIVAVLAVRAVQVSADQVVVVVAMRHQLVPAARAVAVVLGVLAACVLRGARSLVRSRGLEGALVDVAGMLVMQMPFVQVIGVAGMLYGAMAATRAVLMVVPFMRFVSHENTSACGFDGPFASKAQVKRQLAATAERPAASEASGQPLSHASSTSMG